MRTMIQQLDDAAATLAYRAVLLHALLFLAAATIVPTKAIALLLTEPSAVLPFLSSANVSFRAAGGLIFPPAAVAMAYIAWRDETPRAAALIALSGVGVAFAA